MDLEKLNNNYYKLKQKIENTEKTIEKFNQDKENIRKIYDRKCTKLEVAKMMGNDERAKEAEQELLEVEKQVIELKRKMTEQKEIIEKAKTSIDMKIEKIKNDPEISKQIDKALAVRYERKVNKLNKEKNELVAKKDGLVSFKELLDNHPTISNNLRGILSSIEQIKDIDNQIEENKNVVNGITGYKNIGLAASLNLKRTKIKEKFRKNIELLFEYCDRKHINREEVRSYINTLVKNGIKEEQGKVDLNETFNNSINNINEKIGVCDKNIANYKILRGETQQNIDNSDKYQIKWWQFGTRFKNWLEQKRRKKLPQDISYQTKDAKEERKTFNENLKYDIVREIMESKNEENLQYAEEVRTQNEEKAKNEDDKYDNDLYKRFSHMDDGLDDDLEK